MQLIKSLLVAALVTVSVGAQAKYNGEDRGSRVMPAEVNTKWQAECSGCHLAYPAGLLPAASWKKVMAGLDKHFGSDASLAPQDSQEITTYLVKHASDRWTANTAPLRITDGAWFKSKHMSGEINASVWKRASVKSPSNCGACHGGADKGNFNEDSVRIPK
jgi:hypothetical protein